MRIQWRCGLLTLATALAMPLVACSSPSGSSGTSGTPEAGSGETSTDAGAGSEAAVDAPSGSGSGTVAGSIGGAPFDGVGGALWAGAPDDPATTVVYVFSNPVSCSFLQNTGWDAKISDGTKVVEMKAFGSAPGDFTVVTTVTPAPGEASVNFTLSSQSGTPKEQGSTAGKVTLTKLTPRTSATGSFSLLFGASTLTGSFDAVFCPGGHEP